MFFLLLAGDFSYEIRLKKKKEKVLRCLQTFREKLDYSKSEMSRKEPQPSGQACGDDLRLLVQKMHKEPQTRE